MNCLRHYASRVPLVMLLLATCTRSARAHPSDAITPNDLANAWSFEVFVLLPLLVAASLYAVGVARLWRRVGVAHGVSVWQVASYASGIGVLAVALVSPLDALGGSLFSAHMAQHQLLMVIAPPLLLLGAPSVGVLWSLPRHARRSAGLAGTRISRSSAWKTLTHPFAAWTLHAAAIWVWHAPVLYERTLFSDPMHAAQHLSFSSSAMLFWFTVLRPRRWGEAIAVLSVFATAVHGSILAALLTFSSRPWYVSYGGRTRAWGLSLLEDQQLGGLIMWVPTGIVYVGVALWMFASWMASMERRANTPSALTAASVTFSGESAQQLSSRVHNAR